MTAIELMDPKMDARMQIQRKVIYLNEALEKQLLPLNEMPPKLLHGIIDETLSCLVNWLKGDTLGQTVFINMYMHCTDQIENKTLRGACEAIKNIIIFIRDVICKASVAEEEDFYISTSRMPLDDNIADNRVTGMLKEADDDFSRSLKSSPTDCDPTIISLQYRIRFIRNFLLWATVIKKFLQSPCTNSKQTKESVFNESCKYLTALKALIEKMKETTCNGEPVGKGKKDPSKEPYGLTGFEPYLNQPLLPPAIPRCADIEERASAMDYLDALIVKLTHITQILTIDVHSDVLAAWDFIQHFGRFGCPGAAQSCVLTRSLLLTFYMMFFTPHSSMLVDSLSYHFSGNGGPAGTGNKIDTVKSSIRQFIRLACWPEIEATIKLDEKLAIFVGACAENLFQIPITHCLNRSRQRNRLELIIDAHWDLYDECLKVDHILRSYIHQRGAGGSSGGSTGGGGGGGHTKRPKDVPPVFSSFVALFQFRAMFDYLISGFELDLYAPQELVAVYFILGDNVLKYFLSHWREVESTQQRERARLPALVANKKTRKSLDRDIGASLATIGGAALKLQAYYNLVTGLFYVTSALTKDRRLPEMRDACGRYTRAELCYERRFSPVVGRGWFCESASYRQFQRHVAGISEKPVAELYEAAAASFEASRRTIERCPPHEFRESTAAQLDNIAKNNMIVARILARGGVKAGPVQLNFAESKERAFPLIRL